MSLCYLSLSLPLVPISELQALPILGVVSNVLRKFAHHRQQMSKIREKQKKNTETRLVMRAGPELGKKSRGLDERGLFRAVVCHRVQFRVRLGVMGSDLRVSFGSGWRRFGDSVSEKESKTKT